MHGSGERVVRCLTTSGKLQANAPEMRAASASPQTRVTKGVGPSASCQISQRTAPGSFERAWGRTRQSPSRPHRGLPA